MFMPEPLNSYDGSHQHSCCNCSSSASCTDSLAQSLSFKVKEGIHQHSCQGSTAAQEIGNSIWLDIRNPHDYICCSCNILM